MLGVRDPSAPSSARDVGLTLLGTETNESESEDIFLDLLEEWVCRKVPNPRPVPSLLQTTRLSTPSEIIPKF